MSAVLKLASASPRRAEILRQMGVDFRVAAVDVDESKRKGEAPSAYVNRLAIAKAEAAVNGSSELPVLAADTAVALGERVFGKPRDQEDAVAMLTQLSGTTHQVFTAVALICNGVCTESISETAVQFREIHPDEARVYWQSGEPADKAGSYGIQGLGALFVERLNGSYSGVVGLPIFETAQLLLAARVPFPGLRSNTR